MAPSPQEHGVVQAPLAPEADGDRVVISGMAGLYPQARYVTDLQRILYDKVNPITSDELRWQCNHPEVAQYTGNVPELNRFDAQFFKVHFRLGNNMDPMSRKILEQTYEAIYDAGINPEHLSGKKVGVYVGTCFSETEKACFYDAQNRTGFGVAGCSKSMFANRISYWLNAKGPSVSVDQACCSSTAALEAAYKAISHGECEAAVVGGAYLSLHPQSSVHYGRLMKISMDGKTKSFDENAGGCAKSEAINVLFLQRAKDAKRIYADLVHVKCEYLSLPRSETGPVFGFYRAPSAAASFIKSVYDEAGVSPHAVEYVEAFGSAVPEADRAELEALERVFCAGRSEPLPVGSVMSNLGYEEAASGITAITKVLLAFHTGTVASNLHCSTPRQDVAALQDGRMRVLTEHAPFRRTYAAVNSMSVTGVNAHVLLHSHYKHKDLDRYKCNIPRLVTMSNRQEASVERAFNILKSHPIDPEELALLHNIHANNISGHLGRGYIILDKNAEGETVSLGQRVEYCDGAQRPLWFVYSGMGSQWGGMGAHLMRIPIFAAAIQKCHKVLEPRGLDIVHIITSTDKSIFNNILHSFVGIAAVQIGLTDILLELGLVPENIIGHSVGELGCAYADGCLTAEEMILAAYCRGRVSLETPFIRGSMAAVGLGAQQMAALCPPEIAVACHNSAESCTISGPADAMRIFVGELTARGVFAKEVPCSNIAYHSRYIAEAGPALLTYLKEVIPCARARSSRWVSTSVPRERWHQPAAQYSSPEYHTNNLLSPVLFEETSALIPSNAVLVEVAPHGLLQAILKRALPDSTTNVPLTRRGHSDPVTMLIDAVGKLYLAGYSPRVAALYPRVEFPVATGTPLLSHYVQWAHQEKWPLPLYQSAKRSVATSCTFLVSLYDQEYSYLAGHVINKRTVVPFSLALACVWDTLAMSECCERRALSVRFRDVVLHTHPLLHQQKIVRLSVQIHRGSGLFEVVEGNSKVATGFVASIRTSKEEIDSETKSRRIQNYELSSQDVYSIFKESGNNYNEAFQSIWSSDEAIANATVRWDDNWVTYLEALFQLNALKYCCGGRVQPHRLGALTIDVHQHEAAVHLQAGTEPALVHAQLSHVHSTTRSGGVTIQNLSFRDVMQDNDERVTLQARTFVPRFCLQTDGVCDGEYSVPASAGAVRLVGGPARELRWLPAPVLPGTGSIVTVHYFSLNMGDVSEYFGLSLHNKEAECGYGMEFSGVTEIGERVMGVVGGGAASSHVVPHPHLTWPVPRWWSLEDAATVPLAYLLAYYCLLLKPSMRVSTRLVQQYTVLVHGGAGALGQAAIRVALTRGWRVFSTVSDLAKKDFLKRLFPQLNENDIGYSRDASFGDMVLGATNGNGCNVVICCLHGNLKNTSLKCVGPSSTMLDMTQILTNEHYQLGMYHLTNERSYVTVDIKGLVSDPTSEDIAKLHLLMAEGICSGEVVPLTRVVFPPEGGARALRLLHASCHRGRVLLQLHQHTTTHTYKLPLAESSCHMVVSASSSTGLRVADALVRQGIRKLHLHSIESFGPLLGYKQRVWQAVGTQVSVSVGQLSSSEGVVELCRAASLGALAGLYLVQLHQPVLHNIHAATTNLASTIQYFIVMSSEENGGLRTCIERAKNGLPATYVDMSMLDAERGGWEWHVAQDCIQAAWGAHHTVLLARTHKLPLRSLLQQIAEISGINISEDPDSSATLEQLGLASEKSAAVCSYLSDVYHHSISADEVAQLTVASLQEVEAGVRPVVLEPRTALHTFFSHVDPDEMRATCELVRLPTLLDTSGRRDDEFDATVTSLCIVPGLEGLHARFHAHSARLKLPALVLQPGLDRPNDTPTQLAHRYAQVLLRMGLKDLFYILGYETGVVVALELAAILEEHGLTGTVFCVGGGPAEIAALVERELVAFPTQAALDSALAQHMFALMAHGDGAPQPGGEEWDARVDTCVRALLGRVPHSAQYARGLFNGARARLDAARAPLPAPRALRSRIVVVQASDVRPTSLHQYSQHVLVEQLEAPLAHAAAHPQLPALINKHLDENLLRDFQEKNLCDTYLMNADTFMSSTS